MAGELGVLDESDERQAAGPERGGARDRTTFLAETLEPRDRVPAAG